MEDFVTYDIAKKLKEKGFKERCFAYYDPKGCDLYTIQTPFRGGDFEDCMYSYNSLRKECRFVECTDAPTISQVLKWLRNEKYLHIEFISAAYGYSFIVSKTPNRGGTDIYHGRNQGTNDGGAWDKYKECELAGIEYVINNLI